MTVKNQQHGADVARFFQAQYADFDEDLHFYQQLAQSTGGPILELGCGTGRILLPLATAGVVAVGVDHDRAMLARCQAQLAPRSHHPVHLIQAQLQQLPLHARFQLALAPCSTMAFLDDRDFHQALAQVRRLLISGGRLAMDLPAPTEGPLGADEQEVIDHFHEPECGTDIQVSAEENRPADHIRQVDWHYDEMLPDGTIHRQTVTTRYHLRNLERIIELMEGVGLQFEAAYGDYQMGDYHGGSPGMIVIAGC